MVLLLIDEKGPVGRRMISEDLEIKDGIIRGLLERFAEQDIVRVTVNGVELTKQGKAQLKKILTSLSLKKIQRLENLELAPGQKAVAALVPNAYSRGMSGVTERDESIKAGAKGAITITVSQGKLRIPPDDKKLEDLAPSDNQRLLEYFNPSHNDVVVIGFASSSGRAFAGTLAAVFSLQ